VTGHTRLVIAATIGLAAAALGRPLLVLAAVLVGDSGRLRVAAACVGAAALVFGAGRVAALDRRALAPGHTRGAVVVVVTGQPTGSHGLAAVRGAGETIVLSAPGILLEEGGVYRVTGRYQALDPVVRDYYSTQGAHLELRAAEAVRIGRRGGVWGAADTVHRTALGELGVASDPSPPRALVAGIALGDTGALPAGTKAELRASGLYHLVAVSGQNVALVIAFTLVSLGAVGVIGVPARLAALAVTLGYVLVTGAGPSIVRAGVAGGLVAVAWLGSRAVSRWHLLACGAAVVLALDPLELYDPGFQLSFSAVIAIFVVAPRLRGLLGQAAAVSVACTVVTAPIVWWHFGRASPLAIPANLLALPAVAPILWLALVAMLAHAVWPPLAVPLLGLADLLAGYVLAVARSCS
jgi:competence protein ComEC